MTTNLNWAKLIKENRVKSMGIPWSKEDREAISAGMDPEDVRNGIYTKEQKQELESEKIAGKEIPLSRMTKAQLVAKAKGLKIEFDEVIATKGDIILEIEKAEEKLASNKPESTTPEAPKQLPGDDEAKNGQVQAEGEKNAK
jgi:hypothetical protein